MKYNNRTSENKITVPSVLTNTVEHVKKRSVRLCIVSA